MKKKLLVLGMAAALILVWVTPIQSEAFCTDWEFISYNSTPYCATPICYRAIPSQFTDYTYQRYCYSEGDIEKEYKIVKEDHGCCDHL